MFDYLEKFNSLPKNLKDKISNPLVMGIIDYLEKKYEIELAPFVMKIMTKAVPANDLPVHLAEEFLLSEEKAKALAAELKEKVLLSVADYLGISVGASDYDQKISSILNRVMAQVPNITDAAKLGEILRLYLRQIRNAADTRIALIRAFNDLSVEDIEKIIRLTQAAQNTLNEKPERPTNKNADTLGKISRLSTKVEAPYNLAKVLDTKHELTSGIDFSHELAAPQKVAANPLKISY